MMTKKTLSLFAMIIVGASIVVAAGVVAQNSGFTLNSTDAQPPVSCVELLRETSEMIYAAEPGATACMCECSPGNWVPFAATNVCNQEAP